MKHPEVQRQHHQHEQNEPCPDPDHQCISASIDSQAAFRYRVAFGGTIGSTELVPS
jgi:hypothetical protein